MIGGVNDRDRGVPLRPTLGLPARRAIARRFGRALALLVALAVAGCLPYGGVTPRRTTVEGEISVEPSLAWSRINPTPFDGWDFFLPGRVERWTIDGERLDTLTFIVGVPSGEPLFKVEGEKDRNQAKFDARMTPSEIMDLFVAGLAKSSRTSLVEGRELRPVKLGGIDGFRFELSYELSDEIDRELSAAGAVHDGKLTILAYQGAKLYHYGLYLPEFERILASLRFEP